MRNALIVLQAIGGSTNGIVHLAAMAGRAGITLDLDAFDALSKQVPVLIDLKPSGDHYMEHFHHAGGVPRLMQELSDILDLDAPTVFGTLARSRQGRRAGAGADRDPLARKIRSMRRARCACCAATSRRAAR